MERGTPMSNSEARKAQQSTEKDAPEWVKRAVTLRDHFDDWTTMRVAEPQPQYGLVQLNVDRKGVLISVDVKRADLLAALAACVTPPADSGADS